MLTEHRKNQPKSNYLNYVNTIIVLHFLLTPIVLVILADRMINSNFNGFFQLKLDRNGGEIILDRRIPSVPPDKPQ